MNELGLVTEQIASWFEQHNDAPYLLIRVSGETTATWPEVLATALRRCYLSDELLQNRAQFLAAELGEDAESLKAQIVAAKLPNPGSIMSGDFGEIITYMYAAAAELPSIAFGPKKWRLKQDRTKSAPFSDVVQFILPSWPNASEDDAVLCAEVKTKATVNNSTPIASAIADCAKDRISRLAATLAWLRERALGENLGAVQLPQIDRFLNAIDFPEAAKRFRAVAVIDADLLAAELLEAPHDASNDYTLVVISIPELHALYGAVFNAAQHTAAPAVAAG